MASCAARVFEWRLIIRRTQWVRDASVIWGSRAAWYSVRCSRPATGSCQSFAIWAVRQPYRSCFLLRRVCVSSVFLHVTSSVLTRCTDTMRERDKFLDDAMRLVTDLSANQTFASVRPLLNFWAVFSPSEEVRALPNLLPSSRLIHPSSRAAWVSMAKLRGAYLIHNQSFHKTFRISGLGLPLGYTAMAQNWEAYTQTTLMLL